MSMTERIIVYCIAALLVGGIAWFIYRMLANTETMWEAMAKEHDRQLLDLQQLAAQQEGRIRELTDTVQSLEKKIQTVGRTAASGLSEIEKTKKEMEKKYAELANLTDDELDAIIRDGVARYRATHGQGSPGGSGAGVAGAEGTDRKPKGAAGGNRGPGR